MYLSHFITISGEDAIKTEEWSHPQKIRKRIICRSIADIGLINSITLQTGEAVVAPPYWRISSSTEPSVSASLQPNPTIRYQFRHWAGMSHYDLVPVMNGAAILRQHN